MEFKDLLELYKGTIDVFILMESAIRIEFVIDQELGKRANKVYFQPSSSHRVMNRLQMVTGEYSADRPAVIFDTAWLYGNSFSETLEFLACHGYSMDRIYGYYAGGEMPIGKPGPYYNKKVFDTADNVLRMMAEK
jgi:hypothetical protein